MICSRCAKKEGQICLACVSEMMDTKPEVDEAFVAKHLRKLTMRYDATPTPQDYIEMLREAGVRVQEKK